MTYLVILSDTEGNENWSYPTEIEATDKKDAYNAIAENVPPDTIKNILTPAEYQKIVSNKGFKSAQQLKNTINKGAEDYNSSTEFFNNITNAAMQMAENNQNNPDDFSQEQAYYERAKQEERQPIQQNVKYFEDNGCFYKLENNVLYKKCWETIPENPEDKSEQYRILNNETNKIINNPKYSIQKLSWKPIQ